MCIVSVDMLRTDGDRDKRGVCVVVCGVSDRVIGSFSPDSQRSVSHTFLVITASQMIGSVEGTGSSSFLLLRGGSPDSLAHCWRHGSHSWEKKLIRD